MNHYMAELDLRERNVLVVGGGTVARRKVGSLLDCQAAVTVVAPEVSEWLHAQVAAGVVVWEAESFTLARLERVPRPLLVFAAATREVNLMVAAGCRRVGLLCNSADDPAASGFLVPAVVRRGPVAIGVGTGGLSPALSRVLKERVDGMLEPGWGELAVLFGGVRQAVAGRYPVAAERYDFWRRVALRAEAEGWYGEPERAKRFFSKESLIQAKPMDE